jgi:hypothetical protein
VRLSPKGDKAPQPFVFGVDLDNLDFPVRKMSKPLKAA